MTDSQYAILAHVLGLGILLGYALALWCSLRRCGRRAKAMAQRTDSRT